MSISAAQESSVLGQLARPHQDDRAGLITDIDERHAYVSFVPTGLMHRSKRQLYSITSSAWASSVGGTVRPSELAVLMLITNSNLVGCCTGRSDGLAQCSSRRDGSSASPIPSITLAIQRHFSQIGPHPPPHGIAPGIGPRSFTKYFQPDFVEYRRLSSRQIGEAGSLSEPDNGSCGLQLGERLVDREE